MQRQELPVYLYTVKEAAAILHCNTEYVYGLIRSGLLPAIKFKSLRIRKETLDVFLQQYEGQDLSDISQIRPLI